jgi:hypothetical protein
MLTIEWASAAAGARDRLASPKTSATRAKINKPVALLILRPKMSVVASARSTNIESSFDRLRGPVVLRDH